MTEAIGESFAVVLIAVMFFAAGASKLRALGTFEGVVYNFRLLPGLLVRPFAFAIPFAELAVAVGLLVPMFRVYGAWAAVGLLTVFTIAIAVNLIRGRTEIDCGCFNSELKQRLSGWLVLRNVALAGLAAWLAYAGHGIAGRDWVAWLLGGLVAAATIILYVTGNVLATVAAEVAARRAAAAEAHSH